MPIVRTEIDNEEVELEVSSDEIELTEDDDPTDLPGVQSELDRVAGKTRKSAKKTARNQLKEDDEFWQEIAQARGIDLREEDLMPKGASTGEVKELKKELAEYKDKAQRVDELEEQMEQARSQRLENRILKHTEGVKDDLKDVFVEEAKSRFRYDQEDDDFVPVDEEGNPRYAADTEDVIQELREERSSMFRSKSANDGPDVNPGSGSSSPDTVSKSEYLSKAETMSEQEFDDWSENVEIE